MNFLLETTGATSVTQWILPAVLLVLVVGIFVLNYFRSKKNQEGLKNMVNSLKVGDHVKTYSGFYGKILEIVDTTDGKVAVLETGSEKNKGIFDVFNAIYDDVIDPNAPAVEAEKKVEEADIKEVKEETKKETKKPAKKEEIKEIATVEEKKVKKTTKAKETK